MLLRSFWVVYCFLQPCIDHHLHRNGSVWNNHGVSSAPAATKSLGCPLSPLYRIVSTDKISLRHRQLSPCSSNFLPFKHQNLVYIPIWCLLILGAVISHWGNCHSPRRRSTPFKVVLASFLLSQLPLTHLTWLTPLTVNAVLRTSAITPFSAGPVTWERGTSIKSSLGHAHTILFLHHKTFWSFPFYRREKAGVTLHIMFCLKRSNYCG